MQLLVATPETGPRTRFDLSLLLAELDRALAAYAGQGPTSSVRADLARRTALLFELELVRGPIEIERSGQHFSNPELGDLPHRYLAHLVRAMEVHRVDTLRIDDRLRVEDFVRFVELLAVASGHLDDMNEQGFPGRLYESTQPGIELNGVARSEEREAKQTQPLGLLLPIGSAAQRQVATTDSTWPALEEDPLEAPAMLMKGEQLRLSLRQLDRCDDDLLYDALLDRIIAAARELWAQEHREEAYRALLVLSMHASQSSERPASHARMAQSALRRFSDDDVVRFVIERGCSCEGGGIRAIQVLLELGEAPAQAILEALNDATDPARSQQLSSMMLALGDNAVPCLARAISRREGTRLQRAVRLAGELQNPKLVPPLASLFDDSGPALRREAGLALAQVGNGEAREVLFRALASQREDLAVAAAGALAHSGHRDTVGRLDTSLERAIDRGDDRLAAALIRALGAANEVPAYFSKLVARAVSRKDSQRLTPLVRVAVVETLEHMRDERAERWLLAATHDPEDRVSKRAHAILNARDRERSV